MLLIRRVAKGLTLSGLTLAVNFAGQIVSVPLLMGHWGVRTYGAWVALTSLASGITLMNLGIQSYVTNQLILMTARNGRDDAARLLGSALKIYTMFCIAAMGSVVAGLYFLSPSVLLDTGGMSRAESSSIVFAYAVLAVYGIFGGALMNLLRVGQQLPRQLAYGLVERAIILAVPVVIAGFGGRPVHASWAMITVLGIAEVLFVREILRRSPVPVSLSCGSFREGLALIGPGIFFFGSALSTQLLTTGVTLVISHAADAVAVATFTTALMITNAVRLVVHQIVNVFSGEVTLLYASGELERLSNWYRFLWFSCLTAAAAVGALLCLAGPDVVRFWTRDRVRVDFWLNMLLSVYLVAHVPGILSAGFGLAMNRQRAIFFTQTAAVVGAIAISAALVQTAGLNGIVWGLLLTQALSTVALTVMNCRWMNPIRPRHVSVAF